MKQILIIGLVLFSSGAIGQALKTYRVPAGVEIDEVISFDELHRYPDFQRCAIHYVDGKSSLAMANFSLLFQKMVVITVRGDTTFLKNDYLISWFDFGKELIVNDYKYGLVETTPDSIFPKLGKREFLHLIPVEEGTYDGYSNFVDPSSTNVVLRRVGNDLNRVMEDQFARSNVLAERHVDYFFFDKNGRVYPANTASVYKAFPRYKEEIRQFIRKESIDFKEETSLQQLMTFCREVNGRPF